MLHKETVSREMWDLLQKLMSDEKLNNFTLVGGTALSLRIGHRLSVDIDLFTARDFDAEKLLVYLRETYGASDSKTFNNTVLTYIDDIKVDLLKHDYQNVVPPDTRDGIRLASKEDIGAMKLHAIFQSGDRLKDFVDMYFLLDHAPLKNYLDAYERKYNGSPDLAKYALTYFDNIRREYNVSILKGKECSWDTMAQRLRKAAMDPKMDFAKRRLPLKTKPPKRGRGL
ncbi:nucleotidyl transferase AbiEii/AbiGii toxin family protein [Sphingobacterium paludis]|uniref:Nucleotidyltransferase AbiEii toxin of type IV toxin-antitoxin system n=1 Tax=Sphingobacterium paludis TaxID=1476465 RepID=A0A4R7CRP9_9SPHI|nr:nucleotidyl transferase AbiEii/AbiGii toxin family protein [Sphingobacterium paludis]TDS09817.1 nucleotidyltransferase AbiEii toxin of type IV toxin-antitoxin system [Sphingobacterium paludis]